MPTAPLTIELVPNETFESSGDTGYNIYNSRCESDFQSRRSVGWYIYPGVSIKAGKKPKYKVQASLSLVTNVAELRDWAAAGGTLKGTNMCDEELFGSVSAVQESWKALVTKLSKDPAVFEAMKRVERHAEKDGKTSFWLIPNATHAERLIDGSTVKSTQPTTDRDGRRLLMTHTHKPAEARRFPVYGTPKPPATSGSSSQGTGNRPASSQNPTARLSQLRAGRLEPRYHRPSSR